MQEPAKRFAKNMSRLHMVDPTTINSTKAFSVKERNDSGLPTCIARFSDHSYWRVGDYVTNGTQMKGTIKAFNFSVNEDNGAVTCFVDHTWSGIGMGLEDLVKMDQSLPSMFQVKQVVDFILNDTRHKTTINAVHFTESKVRYDLDIWIAKEGGNSSTRIYNVDSCFVEAIA
jgi:hypothetical protein